MARKSSSDVNIVVNQVVGSRHWSPFVAMCLSIVPGLGQLYKGQLLRGLMLLLVVSVGYAALIVPGLFLHLYCAYDAATG